MNRISTFAFAVAAAATLVSAPATAQSLSLTTPAFEHDDPIPVRHSAYGDNISPELAWTGAPEGTRSYALVLHDPDAPMEGGFVHWVIYNIPASATGLPEGIPAEMVLTSPASIAGTTHGHSGLRRGGYFGPRPPAGPVHNYNFRLFALDLEPDLEEAMNSEALMAAIDGHVLDSTTLIGTYQVK